MELDDEALAREAWDWVARTIHGAERELALFRDAWVTLHLSASLDEDFAKPFSFTMAAADWTWPWLDEWLPVFQTWAPWPDGWREVGAFFELRPPERFWYPVTRGYAAGLILQTASRRLWNRRSQLQRQNEAFLRLYMRDKFWILASSQKAEEHVHNSYQTDLERQYPWELAKIPPYFPGDRSDVRARKHHGVRLLKPPVG